MLSYFTLAAALSIVEIFIQNYGIGAEKVKVAYILPSLANRGPNVFTKYLVQALQEFGIECAVFYLREPQDLAFPCKTSTLNFFSCKPLLNFDIVHTTCLRPDFFGFIHKKHLRHRIVVSLHNEIKTDLKMSYPGIIADALERLWLTALNHADRLIVSSSAQLEYYKSVVTGQKHFYQIGYGISHQAPKQLPLEDVKLLGGLREKYSILGTCGLLIKRKGFEQIVMLLRERKDLAAVIIGDGPCRNDLASLATQLGVADRLVLLGFRHNHLDFYPYFDVYLSTSYSEGFGLALIEAMSQGLPVVCTNLRIYEDHFDASQVGLFTPGNLRELTTAVDLALTNRKRFSDASLQLFREKFSSEVMAKAHVALYQSMLNTARDGAT